MSDKDILREGWIEEQIHAETTEWLESMNQNFEVLFDKFWGLHCVIRPNPTPWDMWCPHCLDVVNTENGPACPQCKGTKLFTITEVASGILYNDDKDQEHFPGT